MSIVTLVPVISEKAIALAERGKYVFEVPSATNKIEVKREVQKSFSVTVTSVDMMVVKGKLKRFRQVLGKQRDTKKAIVTLKSGQSIALFEGAN